MRAIHVACLVLALVSAGCNVVRPSAVIDARKLAAERRRSERIRVVITDEYRSFVSTERGSFFGNVQRYEIGPPLAEITKRFFRASFCDVIVGDAPNPAFGEEFVVTPRVVHFENHIQFGTLKQSFGLELAAAVEAANAEGMFGTAGGRSSKDRGIEPNRLYGIGSQNFHGALVEIPQGDAQVEKYLGQMIQDAVEQMVSEVAAEIASVHPSGEWRSCSGR